MKRAAELKLLTPEQGERLAAAHRFYTDVVQMQRVLLPAGVKPDAAAPSVRRRIATCAGLPDDKRLDLDILDTATAVTAICADLLPP